VVFLAIAILLSGYWRISLVAAIIIFLVTMVIHSSLLALVALLLALGLLVLRRWWRPHYVLPIMLALAFSGAVQLVDAYVLHYQLSLRISDTGLGDHARVVLYRTALATASSSPYWGVGDAGVAARVLSLPKKLELFILPKTQQNFHDQYLQWAASEGLFVALAFTLLVSWGVYWCWQLFRSSTDPPARALGLAATAGLAIFLLCNLVDAQFWRIEGGGFYWSLLAVTAAARKGEGKKGTINADGAGEGQFDMILDGKSRA
jgi:O-antigen ligase